MSPFVVLHACWYIGGAPPGVYDVSRGPGHPGCAHFPVRFPRIQEHVAPRGYTQRINKLKSHSFYALLLVSFFYQFCLYLPVFLQSTPETAGNIVKLLFLKNILVIISSFKEDGHMADIIFILVLIFIDLKMFIPQICQLRM